MEAAGGTVAAGVAREAADAFEARSSTGPIAQRINPAAMGAGEAAEPVEPRLEAAARPGTVVRPLTRWRESGRLALEPPAH